MLSHIQLTELKQAAAQDQSAFLVYFDILLENPQLPIATGADPLFMSRHYLPRVSSTDRLLGQLLFRIDNMGALGAEWRKIHRAALEEQARRDLQKKIDKGTITIFSNIVLGTSEVEVNREEYGFYHLGPRYRKFEISVRLLKKLDIKVMPTEDSFLINWSEVFGFRGQYLDEGDTPDPTEPLEAWPMLLPRWRIIYDQSKDRIIRGQIHTVLPPLEDDEAEELGLQEGVDAWDLDDLEDLHIYATKSYRYF
jgi:hypothetical protein